MTRELYKINDIIVFNAYMKLDVLRRQIVQCQFDISQNSYCVVDVSNERPPGMLNRIFVTSPNILGLIRIKTGSYHMQVINDGQFYTIDEICGI